MTLSIQKTGADVQNYRVKPSFTSKRRIYYNQDKSNNGQFDTSEVIKNLGKGVISPITAIVKHPFISIGMLAATAAACSAVPVLAPAMLLGFGALSIGQLGKGAYDAAQNYKNGDYDGAEKSFQTIGEGFVGTVLSFFGVKQSAQISKETKLMNELKLNKLTPERINLIKNYINKNSLLQNMKEILSLFTTKTGLKSAAAQFKPEALKLRAQNLLKIFKSKKVEEEVKIEKPKKSLDERIEEFKKSPEGKRRAAMTDAQIAAEVKSTYNKVFDELGVPEELRPDLYCKNRDLNPSEGGSYSKNFHKITYNIASYRSGVFEMEDVIMHEATHCKEALLRAGIPKDRAEIIVKQELLSRLKNGESEEVLISGGLFGAEMMKPPKMTPEMQKDFAKIAQDFLYKKDDNFRHNLSVYADQKGYSANPSSKSFKLDKLLESKQAIEPFIKELEAFMTKYPDFSKQYKNPEEAFIQLVKYSKSHNIRFNMFSNVEITSGGETLKVKPLNGEELAKAEQSLIDNITTIEGNAGISGFNSILATSKQFNHYQFSPEEVLAQKSGNSFLIKTLQTKINEMKSAGTLTPEYEAYLTSIIEKSKIIIDYKTKGLEYYKLYTQMINNPKDKKLAQTVNALEKELVTLSNKINPKEYQIITKIHTKLAYENLSTVNVPYAAVYQLLSLLKPSEEKE